jgi:peroxiredoxin
VAAEVRALGASLIAVSPQRAEFLRQLITKHKLSFDILTDAGNEVAAKFGLKFTVSDEVKKVYQDVFKLDLEKFNADGSWTLAMPARFTIDGKGIIRYAESDPDYTRRPEPRDTIAALRAVAGQPG